MQVNSVDNYDRNTFNFKIIKDKPKNPMQI